MRVRQQNTTTPDGYRVGADGAWISDAVKKSGEIASVVDVKNLGNRYFMDKGIGEFYIAQNMDNGRYEYYDKNFNLQFSIPWEINGNEILRPNSFFDGITLVSTSIEYGYPTYNYDAFDGAGNHVYRFGPISDMYRFEIGQDANGMTVFAWAKYADALRFFSYSGATGFIEKIYYYTDYPDLEKVNELFGFENGKANLVGRTVTRIENEGYVNQRTYYEDDNVASIDTLRNLGDPIPLMKERQNVANDYVDGLGTSLGDHGAYFELDGADAVLRDVTGAEKFRVAGTPTMMLEFAEIDVVDENYFIARPQGASFESPFHLYQIIYRD